MENEETRGHRPEHDGETRSLTTDIALLAGPSLAVGTKVALDHLTNRPEKEEPPKVELPLGVDNK